VGKYFGEIALIMKSRRSATITSKNYSNIGQITIEDFNQMVSLYPEVVKGFKNNLVRYQDINRCYMKFLMVNVNYFKDLDVETYELLL
jgi:CRP-like cAMP-binding protein